MNLHITSKTRDSVLRVIVMNYTIPTKHTKIRIADGRLYQPFMKT